MSYSVTIEIADVVIPAGSIGACLAAINALHTDEAKGRNKASGGWEQGGEWQLAYRWVGDPPPAGFATLEEALAAWNHSATEHDDGSLELLEHEGENWGDYEVLYKTIAPFVLAGGEITVYGDDHDAWRYRFEDNMLYKDNSRRVWDLSTNVR